MYTRLIIFLLINFAALGIGGMFTGKGVPSEWYSDLNKAPWTPPGWMFGAAWTLIMICFAIFMAYAWGKVENRNLLIALFSLQWVLNVLWNPLFFKYHEVLAALFIIAILTILMIYFIINYRQTLNLYVLWIAPYAIWLIIATSLNAYILLKN